VIEKHDYVIIGGGLAGLATALKIADKHKVLVLTKKEIDVCSTIHAAGGISCVWDKNDTFESHVQDTLVAGDGLCDREVVEFIARKAPSRIKDLIAWGVKFDKKENGEYELTKEGGHSFRRILHYKDITGREIHRALVEQVNKNKNIEVRTNQYAINLIKKKGRCVGVYVYDVNTKGIYGIASRVLVVATGGAGKAYLYTSNPDTATGDGIAMAYRIGAVIQNMECLQFHPTCLYHPLAKNFLISESLRGEGAILKDIRGNRFMENEHPLKELAPRDIVSRAIDNVLKQNGDDFVYLDISFKDPEYIKNRFPGVYQECKEYGIDITKDPIPVVPAAHYTCGGIKAKPNGETNIKGLYAVGECTSTGLHGANRLASNSLLECVVCGCECGELLRDMTLPEFETIKEWESGHATSSVESLMINQNWMEVRQVMQHFVGIIRSDKSLTRARTRISLIHEEVDRYYWDFIITPDLIELRNLVTIGRLIVESAIARKESRGIHYNIDYPEKDEDVHPTEIKKYW
jgi:L-aspartate oxidase